MLVFHLKSDISYAPSPSDTDERDDKEAVIISYTELISSRTLTKKVIFSSIEIF
jgi:hypothetical protein